METRIVETGKITRKPQRSKYGRHLSVMADSLRRDGADGKLRTVDGTAVWAHYKVRRMAAGLRYYARTHKTPGYRLSVSACVKNGLVFRWRDDR